MIKFLKNGSSSTIISNADYQTCLQLCDDIKGNPPPKEGHIYGIKRLRSSSSSVWERTDDSLGKIANATKDGSSVQNDFDNLSPWKDILSFNYDNSQNLVTAYYGDAEFSFAPTDTNVNVFTKIPRFWYKRYEDDEGYEHIQIADYAAEGFLESKEFAVGRYTISGSIDNPRIISGAPPLIKESGYYYPNDFRTAVKTMNNNMCLLDIKALGVLQFLYLVEYADYNSQEKLGYGINVWSESNSGELDQLGMKSGCLINDKSHSVIYRGIEDIFGKSMQYIDGIKVSYEYIYVCYDKNKYNNNADKNNYSKLNYDVATSSGYISKLGIDENNPLVMLPVSFNGSENSYITDYAQIADTNQTYYYFGLAYDANGSKNGLFFSRISPTNNANKYNAPRFILRLND